MIPVSWHCQVASAPSLIFFSCPRRMRMNRMIQLLLGCTVKYLRVIPGDGAVCPSMVVLASIVISEARGITPATSNTMSFFLFPLTAARKDPSPLSLRLVTWMTSPPLPPVTYLPCPSAPGKAGAKACASVLV